MRKVLSATVAAVCVLTGAACAGPAPQAKPAGIVVIDQAGYGKELRQNYDRFSWPPDYRPDLEQLVTATQPAPGEGVQAGLSETVLEVVNSCSWYLSWDAARTKSDAVAADKALRVMTDVLPKFGSDDDPAGKEFVVNAAARAKAGDPQPARQFVAANCDTTKWVAN